MSAVDMSTPIKSPLSDQNDAKPLTEEKSRRRLVVHSHSQTGLRGGINQDAVLATPCFFGVADGVGGGSYGEVASQVALEHCARIENINAQTVAAQVKAADKKVQAAIAELSDQAGATTLAAVWLNHYSGWCCHVGDARIYLIRRNWRGRYEIKLKIEDQTYENKGLEVSDTGKPDDPACMLGTDTLGEPAVAPLTIRPRDMLILCSDGLHHFIPDLAIRRVIERGLKKKDALDSICRRLVRIAITNGSQDDISIVMVYRRPLINL